MTKDSTYLGNIDEQHDKELVGTWVGGEDRRHSQFEVGEALGEGEMSR